MSHRTDTDTMLTLTLLTCFVMKAMAFPEWCEWVPFGSQLHAQQCHLEPENRCFFFLRIPPPKHCFSFTLISIFFLSPQKPFAKSCLVSFSRIFIGCSLSGDEFCCCRVFVGSVGRWHLHLRYRICPSATELETQLCEFVPVDTWGIVGI